MTRITFKREVKLENWKIVRHVHMHVWERESKLTKSKKSLWGNFLKGLENGKRWHLIRWKMTSTLIGFGIGNVVNRILFHHGNGFGVPPSRSLQCSTVIVNILLVYSQTVEIWYEFSFQWFMIVLDLPLKLNLLSFPFLSCLRCILVLITARTFCKKNLSH